MSLQKEEKLPILCTTSVRSVPFSARVSAKAVVILDAEKTCFKHDFETPGKMGWWMIWSFPPSSI